MSKSDQAKAREHRLAAKLRENLRRRKQGTTADANAAPASPPAASKPRTGKQGID
jgi:hypothetical protein